MQVPMVDVIAIGLRAVAYATSLAAAGQVMFVFLYGHLLDRSSRRIRARLLPTALIALSFVTLHELVEPVRLAGEWRGLFDQSLHVLLLSSDFATTNFVRALGLVLIAAGTRRTGPSEVGIAMIGATLVATSFAFMGHTATDPQRWLLAPLLLIHLIAIAFWLGSLWPLHSVAKFENTDIAGTVIGRFSQTAVCVVPLILLAGLAMSVLLLPGLAAMTTPYGIALIAKFGGFSALMLLAGLNKWRLAPGISPGRRSDTRAFRTSVLAEGVLLFAVLTVTALMTALFSPGQ